MPTMLLALAVVHAEPALAQRPGGGITATSSESAQSDRRARSSLATDLDAILADRSFDNASWSISVVSCTRDGERLFDRDGEKNRLVASNIKMLTTAASLDRLGGDYVFETPVFITDTVSPDGRLNGDLVLRASGDPSIAPEFDRDPRRVIDTIVASLHSAGVRSLRRVVVDASAFDAVAYGPGWSWDDEPYGYSAPISAAAMYRNCVRVNVTPGVDPGDSVQIDMLPSTGYVTLRVSATTTRSDSTSTLEIRRTPGSPVITVSGNIAAGSGSYTEEISIDDPPLFVATLLREGLERAGISVTDGVADAAELPHGVDYASAAELVRLRSAPLREVIRPINKLSLNLPAEMLLKTLGRLITGIGSTEAGIEVVTQMLQRAGIDLEQINLVDGSGLSRMDLIAPRDLTRFLLWVHTSPIADDFTASLSVAGEDGTLQERFRGTLAEGNVMAKTGFLTGVRSISGYCCTRDGERLAFSIVLNNYTVPTGVVNTAQELMVMRLAGFTRRF